MIRVFCGDLCWSKDSGSHLKDERGALGCSTCKLHSSSNWCPRQLERRDPHRGADQRPNVPRDSGPVVGEALVKRGQRLQSPVFFWLTPHTHARCPSIAYWITPNQSIKVTWSSSTSRLTRAALGCITDAVLLCVGSLKNKTSDIVAPWLEHLHLRWGHRVRQQFGKAPSWIWIHQKHFSKPAHTSEAN